MNIRRDLDIGLLSAICVAVGVGITIIYSASYNWDLGLAGNIYGKQVIWAALGLIAMGITLFIPLRYFFAFAPVLYGLTVALLVLVLELGDRRWFTIGTIHIQPSELAKITTVLVIARFLAHRNRDLTQVRAFIPPLFFVLVPILLVSMQPDLGTAMVFSTLILPMFFWAGARPMHLLFLILPALTLVCAFHPWTLVSVVLLIIVVLFIERPRILTSSILFTVNLAVAIAAPYVWENKLHAYQKRRILTYLEPDLDKLGAGYQVIQSKIAIGSGGLMGKGFLEGTQTKLAFLPEQHTDFIFSVICEEFGFLGAFFVLALFIFILWRALSIAVQTKSRFSSLTAIGLATILFFHVFVNIGMTVGIMPVTGLPLPFLSYGGSTLITNMILIGLLLNMHANRYEDY